VSFNAIPSFAEFVTHLEKTVVPGGNFANEFSLQYLDEEGDKVTIGSQPEWEEAVQILTTKGGLFKLFVVAESKSQPQQQQQQQPCLGLLLKQLLTTDNLKSLVDELPNWLEFEVDVTETKKETENSTQPGRGRRGCFPFRRHHKLQKKGINLLNQKAYLKAKKCFEKMVKHFPTDCTARYNLGCTYSLLSCGPSLTSKEKEETQQKALILLGEAISLGYSNGAHLEADPDFEPIRHLPEFQELLLKVKGGSQPMSQPTTPSVQPEETSSQQLSPDNTAPSPTQVQHAAPQTVPNQQALVEERKQVHAESKEFEAELAQLKEMGFVYTTHNVSLLRANQGDLARVISSLL